MNIQIDHVVIAGRNLDAMRQQFTATGLTPDPGGVHADGQTHNALVGFADGSYLELIAPTPGHSAPHHTWSAFMNADSGTCAWAIRSSDIQADIVSLHTKDIAVSNPVRGGRTRPDGVKLEWIIANLGSGPNGSVLPFLIQDITPCEWRVPSIASTDTGTISGVAEVIIGCSDFAATIDLFRRAFGWPEPVAFKADTSEADNCHFENSPVSLREADQTHVCGVLLKVSNLDPASRHYRSVGEAKNWHGHSFKALFEKWFGFGVGLLD